MIFPTASENTRPIAPALRSMALKMEAGQPGVHVLAAREFRYPVHQHEVSIHAENYRNINLLEHFLLQAYTEIVPRPSLEEIAEALGLAPIFIRRTFQDLIAKQSLAYGIQGPHVTDDGLRVLQSKKILEPLNETHYLIQDTLLNTTGFFPQRLRPVRDDLEDLSHHIGHDLFVFQTIRFDTNEVLAHLQEWGLNLHNPDESRFVRSITPTAAPEIGWRTLSVFILYDTLEENPEKSIRFEVRSFTNQIEQRIGQQLETQLQQRNLSLKALCGLLDEQILSKEGEPSGNREHIEALAIVPEVEERLTNIRQQAVTHLRLQQKGLIAETLTGTSQQLRDNDIRPTFIKTLEEAGELIIIYSPWMNEQVVDREFIALLKKLVQKGVRILIGYGIERDERKEGRPVSPQLLQRLQDVQTPEGTPGIIAEWLGNSHAKEVIIDHKVHFSGSHNWLSYRGDRFPRGETVYQVTIASEVEKAYNYLAQRFIERAQNLWRSTDEERKRALCILMALRYEQQAIEWIQRDGYYNCIPFWLKLVARTISLEFSPQVSEALQRALTLCCTTIDKGSPLTAEIVEEFRKILKRLTIKEQRLTASFIENNLAALEQLGIDQYVRDLSVVHSREQIKKNRAIPNSNSRQEGPTQRQNHNKSRPKRNH